MIGKIAFTCVAILFVAVSASAAGAKASSADLSAIKQAMEDRLKDADSAKIKDVKIAKDGTTCGQVNAKNSYGAYSGFEPFIAMKLSAGKFYVVGVGDTAGELCASKGI